MNEFQKLLKRKGIKQWKAAEYLGIREDAFSRMMRHELPKEESARLLAIIIEKHGKESATKND